MSGDLLYEVVCPNCQNPIDLRQHGEHVRCDACGSQFLLNGHLCPECQSYHSTEAPFCAKCGAALTRVCRRCRTSNWAGDEYCVECGASLDIFDLLALQHRNVRQDMLEENWQQIRDLRELEEAAARQRSDALQAIENDRQEYLRQRLANQQRQERRLLVLAGIAVALFLLVAIVSVLYSVLR